MSRASSSFSAASRPRTQRTPFAYAYDRLIRDIKNLTAGSGDINQFDVYFRDLFRNFLQELDMPLAARNFEALLQEKDGQKYLRNDGSVNWYHEFIPLLMVTGLVRQGYRKGGIDIADLQPYGGLEVLICTHLRHDSVEDFTSNNDMIRQQLHYVQQICAENPAYDSEAGNMKALQTIINIDLMTQKKIEQPDGSQEKEDVVSYTYRMVESEHANPVVFMLKQADVIHNFATLFGADKFTPERRLKRCNEREDMYGPRYGFTDIAQQKWKYFNHGIKTLDSMMGIMLYPHFRYLESVDEYYKKPYDIPVGIGRYIRGALGVHLPEAVNPLHIFFKRLATSIDRQAEPEKHAKLQNFMQKVVMRPLEPFAGRFPYLFQKNGIVSDAPQPPVASP